MIRSVPPNFAWESLQRATKTGRCLASPGLSARAVVVFVVVTSSSCLIRKAGVALPGPDRRRDDDHLPRTS